jgi:hypothetical protein
MASSGQPVKDKVSETRFQRQSFQVSEFQRFGTIQIAQALRFIETLKL